MSTVEPRRVIVTVATTGSFLTRDMTPHVPITPQEIADVATECRELGAAVAHVHARRPDGSPTCDPEVYGEINQLIRDQSDIVVNNSLGGGFRGDMVRELNDEWVEVDFEKRLKALDAKPEMATLNIQSVAARVDGRNVLFSTTTERIERLAERMRELQIKPEFEIVGPPCILRELRRIVELGLDSEPYIANLVVGYDHVFQGAMPYAPRHIQYMVDLLPPGAVFNVTAWWESQLPAMTLGILLGGHVHVGLEDNPDYRPGELTTNQELVKRCVRIIRELNCEPATPAEAREILQLPSAQGRPVHSEMA